MADDKCRKTGKIKHPDKAGAVRLIARLARSEPSMRRLQAYQCKSCKQWHIGIPHRRAAA